MVVNLLMGTWVLVVSVIQMGELYGDTSIMGFHLHISVIRCNVQGLSGIDLSPKSGGTMFLGNIFIILVLSLLV